MRLPIILGRDRRHFAFNIGMLLLFSLNKHRSGLWRDNSLMNILHYLKHAKMCGLLGGLLSFLLLNSKIRFGTHLGQRRDLVWRIHHTPLIVLYQVTCDHSKNRRNFEPLTLSISEYVRRMGMIRNLFEVRCLEIFWGYLFHYFIKILFFSISLKTVYFETQFRPGKQV